MPAIMLVDPANEKIKFLQPIEDVTEDTIADLVGEIVFVDLFDGLQRHAVDDIVARPRSAPEFEKQQERPERFNGMFNEL